MRLAVTMGDPHGVGPEIIAKSLGSLAKRTIPVIIGDLFVLKKAAQIVGTELKLRPFKEGKMGEVEVLDLGILHDVSFGLATRDAGLASYRYIEEALGLISTHEVEGVVTCPVNKATISLAGIPFSGHTEVLASFSSVSDCVMMMIAGRMRVSLVTTHIPLRSVPERLGEERIFRTIYITSCALREYLCVANPRLKVCGLNPHAGEKGLLGEEEEQIRRAIERARDLGIDASGPYAADSVFHKVDCDAFVAMYHDQGLIPVKTLNFRKTVNVTLGLPFVRTSVGHGVAYEIAGKGLADAESFKAAYSMAERMIVRRYWG
ncbi:MAG: 4-hydroxythreonine-4-phosphate dehydrogenase PdxA [Candidatus Bathyarchaeia archaeon]